jgi:lysophospholipase L1-like esterase
MNSKDKPRPELFVEDKLHLSELGYELWASLIRRRLDEVLRARADQAAAQAVGLDSSDR